MANIGSFKKSGSEFQGEIVTLSVQTKNVRIVPETNRANDNAPSHRVYVGRAEIGAAWSKRSNEGRDHLSVKLNHRASTRRSTPTSSTTRTATATRSSGPAPAGRTAAKPTPLQRPARHSGRGFRVSIDSRRPIITNRVAFDFHRENAEHPPEGWIPDLFKSPPCTTRSIGRSSFSLVGWDSVISSATVGWRSGSRRTRQRIPRPRPPPHQRLVPPRRPCMSVCASVCVCLAYASSNIQVAPLPSSCKTTVTHSAALATCGIS